MAIPTLADTDIDRDSALKQLVMQALRDRDLWNWINATGSGINPNVVAFIAKLLSHKHDGTAGHGAKIPTAGIATDAVNDSAMMGVNSVSATEVDTKTMDTVKIQNRSVTAAKLHSTMGSHGSGTWTYNTSVGATGIEVAFKGDRVSVGNPKGALGVICNTKKHGSSSLGRIDHWVISQSAGSIVLALVDDGTLVPGVDQTAGYDFYVM